MRCRCWGRSTMGRWVDTQRGSPPSTRAAAETRRAVRADTEERDCTWRPPSRRALHRFGQGWSRWAIAWSLGTRGYPGRSEDMMRIALVVVWGGVMFAAGEAGACEAHAAKARATAPVSADSRREDTAPDAAAGKKDGVGEPHAAKCQCSSAADCTCKKGSCDCARCKPRRE